MDNGQSDCKAPQTDEKPSLSTEDKSSSVRCFCLHKHPYMSYDQGAPRRCGWLTEQSEEAMAMMNALVKRAAEPGLWLERVPVPEIGPNDVRIRVLRASICGTDIHIYNWDAWAQKTIKPPMVIGHEYVGVIDAVGNNVADHYPGELVVGEGHIVCGGCRNCLAGRRHLCQ